MRSIISPPLLRSVFLLFFVSLLSACGGGSGGGGLGLSSLSTADVLGDAQVKIRLSSPQAKPAASPQVLPQADYPDLSPVLITFNWVSDTLTIRVSDPSSAPVDYTFTQEYVRTADQVKFGGGTSRREAIETRVKTELRDSIGEGRATDLAFAVTEDLYKEDFYNDIAPLSSLHYFNKWFDIGDSMYNLHEHLGFSQDYDFGRLVVSINSAPLVSSVSFAHAYSDNLIDPSYHSPLDPDYFTPNVDRSITYTGDAFIVSSRLPIDLTGEISSYIDALITPLTVDMTVNFGGIGSPGVDTNSITGRLMDDTDKFADLTGAVAPTSSGDGGKFRRFNLDAEFVPSSDISGGSAALKGAFYGANREEGGAVGTGTLTHGAASEDTDFIIGILARREGIDALRVKAKRDFSDTRDRDDLKGENGNYDLPLTGTEAARNAYKY